MDKSRKKISRTICMYIGSFWNMDDVVSALPGC